MTLSLDLEQLPKYNVFNPPEAQDGLTLESLITNEGPVYHAVQKQAYVPCAAYLDVITKTVPYAGYGQSELSTWMFREMPSTPFGQNAGFRGVTRNFAYAEINSSVSKGDITQQLITRAHEWVLHIVNQWSDNDPLGFYHTRRMMNAMFPKISEIPPDPYAKEPAYRN